MFAYILKRDIGYDSYNGVRLLRYAMIISVQKLAQVIKSNTAGFLRIQRHNREMLKRILGSKLIERIPLK